MATRGKKRRRSRVDKSFTSASEVNQSSGEDGEGTGGPVKKHARHHPTAATHKAQLANLATTDPSFYQFLQEQDSELLEFSEEDEDISDQSDDAENLTQSDQATTPVTKKIVVTYQMALKWKKSIIKDGVSSVDVKNIIEALHCGVSSYMTSSSSHDPNEADVLQYKVNDDQVFNLLLSTSLQLLPALLQQLNSHSKLKKRLKLTVKLFATDLLQLIQQFTDANMLCAVLRAVRSLMQCYVAMTKLSRNLVKVLVSHWAGSDDLVTVGAFLCLRQLIHHKPQSFESVAKQLYLRLVASARFAASDKMKLLQTSLIELFKMDVATGYQMCFVYMRQLAVSVRNAYTTSNAQQSVMSWQFLRSIQLWSHLLLCDDASLKPLVYPLVQICLSCIRLQQKVNHFPFHLHIAQLLISLTNSHGCYVPIATILIEILEYKFPTKSLSKGKPVTMETTIRLSKQLLHSRLVQSALLDKAYELLLEHLCGFSHSIGFPELVLPVTLRLSKVTKTTKVPWLSRQLKQLVTKLEEHSTEIMRERSSLTFGPSDLEQVNVWESQRKDNNNSLRQFLTQWKQMKELQTTEEQNDEIM